MSSKANKDKRKKNTLKALLSASPSPLSPPPPSPSPLSPPPSFSFTKSPSSPSLPPPPLVLTFLFSVPSLSSPLPLGTLLPGPVRQKVKERERVKVGWTERVTVAGLVVVVRLARIEKSERSEGSERASGLGSLERGVERMELEEVEREGKGEGKREGGEEEVEVEVTAKSAAAFTLVFEQEPKAANPSSSPSHSLPLKSRPLPSHFFGYTSLLSRLASLLSTTTDGILLSGPSGIGKTSLLRTLLSQTPHVYVDCASLITPVIGHAERTLSALMSQPLPVVLDNLDAIGTDRSKSPLTRSLTSTLLALLDSPSSSRPPVLGAAQDLSSLDVALRRPGRFSREVPVPSPTLEDRVAVLTGTLEKFEGVVRTGGVDVEVLAAATRGYVAADITSAVRNTVAALVLSSLALRAASSSLNPSSPPPSSPPPSLTTSSIRATLASTPPSVLRDLSVTIPSLPWSSIGGMASTKAALQSTVTHTLTHPAVYAKYKVTPPNGIMLYGPPGCSKTLMAKALCSETGMNFIAVKGPELLSKYLGESETKLAKIFAKARQASPCVVFFDEVDSMAAARGAGGGAADRLLAQLLTELDGVRGRDPAKRVVVVAATNRPDLVDPALVRPGRIDRMVYVGPPDGESREQIWRIGMKGKAVVAEGTEGGVDYEKLAALTEGCSGAEIVGSCRDAAINAILDEKGEIGMDHCERAAGEIERMITKEMIDFYERFRDGLDV